MRQLVSLVLALTLISGLAFAQGPRLTAIVHTEHFIVHCEPNMANTAEIIASDSEYWIGDISRRLDARSYLKPRIPMFIYRNQGDFEKATGQHRPGMVLGRASSEGYVELDASGIFAPAQQIAGHEITHVLIFRILAPDPMSLPLWANEGIAKYMTDDWSQSDRDLLAEATIAGDLLPLQSISRQFPDGQAQSLAYAQGASAIKFLTDRWGEKSIAKLVHATAKTGSFDRAMRNTTGLTTKQFEQQWQTSIEGRFGIAKILRIARIITAIAMPLLIILAYLNSRRKRRRALERYRLEEWEEANWRDWGGTP